ncbi:MAG: TadE/TadG family type IV pilus assembly protein, partial [Alphaproteobacteria bacterium]|nr:TadE/TadG family type IV pilus assembly protein [Alphaproteobacteria bacterium]
SSWLMNSLISAFRRIRFSVKRFGAERSGAAAVTFALVLPLATLLSLGTLETALMMFDRHRANEAVRQMGRALALAPPLSALDGLDGGESMVCSGGGGSLSCNGSGTKNTEALDNALAKAKEIYPKLSMSNINVEYEVSGLGPEDASAGLMALITVTVSGLTYDMKIMPPISSKLEKITYEDFTVTLVRGG